MLQNLEAGGGAAEILTLCHCGLIIMEVVHIIL